MPFSTAHEPDLEIIEENNSYFIGRTDEWPDYPDGKVVLGYDGKFKNIIPIDYFELMEDPEEYNKDDNRDCFKQMCISSGVLTAPRDRDDLLELYLCRGCHETMKEEWKKLLENNPELGVSEFL